MAQSYEAGFPPMILTDDYIIAFEARSVTGAAVAGVSIDTPMILAEKIGDIEFLQEVIPPYTDLAPGDQV